MVIPTCDLLIAPCLLEGTLLFDYESGMKGGLKCFHFLLSGPFLNTNPACFQYPVRVFKCVVALLAHGDWCRDQIDDGGFANLTT